MKKIFTDYYAPARWSKIHKYNGMTKKADGHWKMTHITLSRFTFLAGIAR